MRRPAHGGTCRPGLARPGSGFGRPLRQRPLTIGVIDPTGPDAIGPTFWFERELELALGLELEVDGRGADDHAARSTEAA
jgi:hypothetical protein